MSEENRQPWPDTNEAGWFFGDLDLWASGSGAAGRQLVGRIQRKSDLFHIDTVFGHYDLNHETGVGGGGFRPLLAS